MAALATSLLALVAILDVRASADVASPKVVRMDMARSPASSSSSSSSSKLAMRNSITVPVVNAVSQGLYFVNVSVGTPPQTVQLQIDTGSSDTWFFGPESCDDSTSPCLGGVYDPSDSSSVKIIGEGDFKIQYGTPDSDVVGDYITDDFHIGGVTIKNLTMAVATDAKVVPTGIMGIGFDTEESIVVEEHAKPYPNIIDLMVEQGLINTRAYSLWLNDLEARSGSVLFGGYDTSKFSGKLLTLPIQPDSRTGSVSTMTVAWTGLSVTNTTTGESQTISSDNLPAPALLDSGTTATMLPPDLYERLAGFFGAIQDPTSDGALVQCDLLQTADGTLDFEFGGTGGPVIKVPFSEFAIPLEIDTWGLCQLGLMPATDPNLGVILGDTFLRSAYVVYDLDSKQISLAQTVFNTTESNVVEIKQSSSSSSGSAVGSMVTGVTVTQTATGLEAPGIATATGRYTGTALATSTVSPSSKSGAAGTIRGAFSSAVVSLLSMIVALY